MVHSQILKVKRILVLFIDTRSTDLLIIMDKLSINPLMFYKWTYIIEISVS